MIEPDLACLARLAALCLAHLGGAGFAALSPSVALALLPGGPSVRWEPGGAIRLAGCFVYDPLGEPGPGPGGERSSLRMVLTVFARVFGGFLEGCKSRFVVNHWARRDSNPEPWDYESRALPLSYRPMHACQRVLPCRRPAQTAGAAPQLAVIVSALIRRGRVPANRRRRSAAAIRRRDGHVPPLSWASRRRCRGKRADPGEEQ